MRGSPKRQRMITAMFRDPDSAERAYRSSTARGYRDRDINVAMSDDRRKRYLSDAGKTELGNKATEGAGVGGAVGAAAGAAVAAVGTSLVMPGFGRVIAEPAAPLAGSGVTGGLIGALVGWGIPEERVKHYDAGIKQGGIVMGVTPRSNEDAEYLEREWKSNKGEHVYR